MSARSTYIFVVKCRYFVIVAAKRPTQCVTAMPTTAAATSFVMPGWKMADGKGPLLMLDQ